MVLTASKLSEHVHRILGRVLKMRAPAEARRMGGALRILPTDPPSRIARLKRRPYLLDDPEEIVHMDWSW